MRFGQREIVGRVTLLSASVKAYMTLSSKSRSNPALSFFRGEHLRHRAAHGVELERFGQVRIPDGGEEGLGFIIHHVAGQENDPVRQGRGWPRCTAAPAGI